MRLRFALALFFATLAGGTLGYAILLDMDFLDAAFFTIITITTVGYGIPVNVEWTRAAEIFTTLFILGGVAVAYYTLGVLIAAIVGREIRGQFSRRRIDRKIKSLSGHTIICGFGRIGQALAETFQAESVPFAVIELEEEPYEEGLAAGYLMVRGDATSDEALLEAGLERARRIVPALPSDADNLFVVISARQINAGIEAIARATDRAAADKMLRAGATRVVRPVHIGAQHLAQAVLRPSVVEFFRFSGRSPDQDYSLEEVTVDPKSPLAGRTLQEVGMREEIGVVVIGIRGAEDGNIQFNPSAGTKLHAGDTMVAFGKSEEMDELARRAGPNGPA